MERELHNNKTVTKEMVRDLASALFSEKGYSDTTLDLIAQRLNMPKPQLYSLYNSKKAIMADIIRHAYQILKPEMPTVSDIQDTISRNGAKEALYNYCNAIFSNLTPSKTSLYLLLCSEVMGFKRIPVVMARLWNNQYRIIKTVIEQLGEAALIPKDDFDTLAIMIARIQFTYSVWGAQHIYGCKEQYHAALQLIINVVLYGVRPLEIDETVPFQLKNMGTYFDNTVEKKIKLEAFHLFCKQGFKHTTIQQISENAQINPSRIYACFQSKHELLHSLFRDLNEERVFSFHTLKIFEEYAQSQNINQLVTGLAGGYIFGPIPRIVLDRFYLDKFIREYAYEKIIKDTIDVADSITQLKHQGLTADCDSRAVAFAYIFIQASINLQNAVLDRPLDITHSFRVRCAALLVSYTLFGFQKPLL